MKKVFPASQALTAALLACLLIAPLRSAVPNEQDIGAWILELGGSFKEDNSGHIMAVDLSSSWVSDSDLAKLGTLIELREINLSHTRLTDLAFEQLKSLENVTHLDCYYCDFITDGAIAYLKDWKNLESLNLRGTDVTSRTFEHVSHMNKLKVLDVSFSRVNDNGFEQLAELEELRELHIGGNKMRGLGLPLLRMLPALRHLDVNGSQRTDSGRWGLMLTDANVHQFSALVDLEVLNMAGAQVTDVGMQALAPLVDLHTLDLSRMQLTAKGLEPVTQLPKLRRLNLWQCTRMDDKAASYLLQMKSLEVLDLGETSVTDAALDQFEKMEQLKELFIGGTQITRERVEQFRKTRPDCNITWWEKQKVVESEEDTRLIG